MNVYQLKSESQGDQFLLAKTLSKAIDLADHKDLYTHDAVIVFWDRLERCKVSASGKSLIHEGTHHWLWSA